MVIASERINPLLQRGHISGKEDESLLAANAVGVLCGPAAEINLLGTNDYAAWAHDFGQVGFVLAGLGLRRKERLNRIKRYLNSAYLFVREHRDTIKRIANELQSKRTIHEEQIDRLIESARVDDLRQAA